MTETEIDELKEEMKELKDQMSQMEEKIKSMIEIFEGINIILNHMTDVITRGLYV